MRISCIITIIVFLFFNSITLYSQEINRDNKIEDEIISKSTIGCILPLSGENLILGEKALRGVESAMSLTELGSTYEIFVKDINNNELNILNSYTDLVVNNNPSFVIGPIRSNAVKTVSKVVTKHKMPTITFPVYRDSSESSPYLVKFYYPIDDQVTYLADYSIKTLKLRNFAILYPKTKLGKRFKEKFVNYSQRLGARIVHTGSYDLDISDIDVEISWIKSFKPDAILIPDYPSRSAKIIKKILSDKNYLNVLFLGPNSWNSKAFAESAGEEIDGLLHKAIFTDFLLIGSDDWKDFYNYYTDKFNNTPTLYEYQIYQATKMFLSESKKTKNKRYKLITNIMNQRGKGRYIVRKSKYGLEVYPKPFLISLEDKKLVKLQ